MDDNSRISVFVNDYVIFHKPRRVRQPGLKVKINVPAPHALEDAEQGLVRFELVIEECRKQDEWRPILWKEYSGSRT